MRFELSTPTTTERGLSFTVEHGGACHEVSFIASRPVQPAVGNTMLSTTLLPAMTTGAALALPASVSPELLANAREIQRVFASWDERLVPIAVDAESRRTRPTQSGGVASFFSGGVDSFFTVLRNLDRIDLLVFLRGFDIPAHKPALGDRISARVREIAAELGKDLVEIDIAVRAFSDAFVPWELYFTSPMAAVAHILDGQVSEMLLPASLSLADLVPCGSHPLTDHLWGSASVSITNEGAEVDRAEKLAVLAHEPIAMRNLRVCWENPDDEYNCGRCRKCLMTMAGLEAVGALGICTTLPPHLDAEELDRVEIPEDPILALATYYLASFERGGKESSPTAESLRRMIGRYRKRQAEAMLGPLQPAVTADQRPAGYRLVDALASHAARHKWIAAPTRRAVRAIAPRRVAR
jgi:hypothetical protein